MPTQHASAGLRPYDTGLVLQSRPQIDTNEFGLKQGTLRFLVANALWPGIEPARTTPCDEFTAGDAITAAYLLDIPFMACQTARFTHSGHCPGVGILEVLVQGAIFQTVPGGGGTTTTFQRIVSIDITDKGGAHQNSSNTGFSSPPTVVITGGGTVNTPANIVTRLEMDTRDTVNGGTGYAIGDIVTAVGGTFLRPIKLLVVAVGTSNSIKAVDGGGTSFHDRGLYSAIPANPVTLSGGTGSGATANFQFKVGAVIVNDGGSYTATPTVSLTGGGTPTFPAVLGTVTMATGSSTSPSTPDSEITVPFNPDSSTKETITFALFAPGTGGGTVTAAITARLVDTVGLTSYESFIANNGTIRLRAISIGPMPLIDGRQVSANDRLLLTAQANSAHNGLYSVIEPGRNFTQAGPGAQWMVMRVPELDDAASFTTTLYIQILDGTNFTNSRWHCTTTVATLGTSPITFVVDPVQPAAQVSVTNQITIEYHTIDLHFEYVSRTKVQRPKFIQNEYTVGADGMIIVDPTTGDKKLLLIDSAIVLASSTNATTGEVTFSQVGQSVPESTWRPAVRYKGTASRFEETPSGEFWHVLETTSIKIDPIVPFATQ